MSAPWGAAAGPDPVHQELEEPGAVAVYARPRVADVVRTFARHPLNYAAGWMLELLDPPARPVLPDSNCSMTGGTASSAIFRVQQLPAHPVSQAWVRPEAIWDRSFRTTIFALLMVGRTLYHTVRRADPAKGQFPPLRSPPRAKLAHTHSFLQTSDLYTTSSPSAFWCLYTRRPIRCMQNSNQCSLCQSSVPRIVSLRMARMDGRCGRLLCLRMSAAVGGECSGTAADGRRPHGPEGGGGQR